jgi:hypothetical protein
MKDTDSLGPNLGKWALSGGRAVPNCLFVTPFLLGPFKMAWLWLLCALLPAFMVSGECFPPLQEQY